MSAIGKIPYVIEQLLKVNPQEALNQFRDLNPVTYYFTIEERSEIIDYLDKQIALYNKVDKSNIFTFEDVVFNFVDDYIKIGDMEKNKTEYGDFHDSSNITYKRKALCLIFAVLYIYDKHPRQDISINNQEFSNHFGHAFNYIISSREGGTEPILATGTEKKSVVPIAKQIIKDYSTHWKITSKGDIIKVEIIT